MSVKNSIRLSKGLPVDVIPGEEWRCIPGHEGHYQVSSLGRVKSVARPGRQNDGLMVAHPHASGYLAVGLRVNSKGRTVFVHHLVAATFIGSRPLGLTVNHKDGQKWNNTAINLEYVTQSENNLHALRTGLRVPVRGERVYGSKLTANAVLAIREAAKTEKISDVAKRYGVSTQAAWRIVRRLNWTHV